MFLKKIASERNSSSNYLPPWARHEHQKRYEFAKKYVNGKDVIDCACGSGESSAIFAGAGAKSVVGIDLDEQSVLEAQTKYVSENLSFQKSDGLKLPVPDASCDVMISLETIEHILDDDSFVVEITRVLRPEGLLICSTPNRTITNPRTSIADKPWNQFHVREYSYDEFIKLFKGKFDLVLSNGQNPSLRIRRFSIEIFAKAFGTKASIRLLQLWKCRWFLLRKSRLHAVQPGVANTFEFFVLVLKKIN